MKRVLVTGARGFIGRHCLPVFGNGSYDLHAVTSSEAVSSGQPSQITWHRVDLMDGRAPEKLIANVNPTHLLHLAWITTPGEYWTSPVNYDWLDVSQRLLDAFMEHGGERIVIVGTCAEYDWSAGLCDERRTPTRSLSPYSESKNRLCAYLNALIGEMDVSAAWARVFFSYGPHEPPVRLVPTVIRRLLHGKPASCSAGEQRRDYIYVNDVAAALVALLDSETRGVVNIGSGTAVAVRDLIMKIGVAMGTPELIHVGSRSSSENDPALVLANVSRLNQEVGFSPRWDLETGLKATIDWWRTVGDAGTRT